MTATESKWHGWWSQYENVIVFCSSLNNSQTMILWHQFQMMLRGAYTYLNCMCPWFKSPNSLFKFLFVCSLVNCAARLSSNRSQFLQWCHLWRPWKWDTTSIKTPTITCFTLLMSHRLYTTCYSRLAWWWVAHGRIRWCNDQHLLSTNQQQC